MSHLNQSKMLSLHNFPDGEKDFNDFESARTEKYNRYSPEIRKSHNGSPKIKEGGYGSSQPRV